MESDKLRVEIDSQRENLKAQYSQELNFEKERLSQIQFSLQQKLDKEKKEMEQNLMKSMKQLEQRLVELDINNKDLLEKKYKFESQLQELKLKHGMLQEEYESNKLELSASRKENSRLDSELHNCEKLQNQLKTRISLLEQELKDKNEAFNRSQELFNNEQNQKKQLDDLLKEKIGELKKQAEVNHYVQEFKKGSDVVNKLQEREKSLSGQLKLKTRILTEQEKVMKEKEKQIEELTSELKESNKRVDIISEENKELKNSVQKKTVELEEAAKLLKRDENIINWLNKQLNENNIGINSQNTASTTSFRPYGVLTNTNLNNSSIPDANTYNRPNSTVDQFYIKPSSDLDPNKRYPLSNQNPYIKTCLSQPSTSTIHTTQPNNTLKENQET